MLSVARNPGWHIAGRVARLGVSLLEGVWVARYLGPGQYGVCVDIFKHTPLLHQRNSIAAQTTCTVN